MMANRILQRAPTAAHVAHAGAAALALALGVHWSDAVGRRAAAGARPRLPKKPPAAAAGAKDAPARRLPRPRAQSAWVKLCEKANGRLQGQGRQGGEEGTQHLPDASRAPRRQHGHGAGVGGGAAGRGPGQAALHGHGAARHDAAAGHARHALSQGPLGARRRRTRRSTRRKLKGLKLGYTLCHPAGCTAEMEATAELISRPEDGAAAW